MREDQRVLCEALKSVFPPELVVPEWPALRDEVGAYSPRVDIAVGPFATHAVFADEYDQLCIEHREFLEKLTDAFHLNVTEFGGQQSTPSLDSMLRLNHNARCFLAIEIEGSGSRKHIMGGVVNASSLGRLGLSVASSDRHLRTLLRVREYMYFLRRVRKHRFDPTNSLLLTTQQLARVLDVTLDV